MNPRRTPHRQSSRNTEILAIDRVDRQAITKQDWTYRYIICRRKNMISRCVPTQSDLLINCMTSLDILEVYDWEEIRKRITSSWNETSLTSLNREASTHRTAWRKEPREREHSPNKKAIFLSFFLFFLILTNFVKGEETGSRDLSEKYLRNALGLRV